MDPLESQLLSLILVYAFAAICVIVAICYIIYKEASDILKRKHPRKRLPS